MTRAPCEIERPGRRRVARFLDRDGGARLDERPADDVDRLLCAVRDDDVVGAWLGRRGSSRCGGRSRREPSWPAGSPYMPWRTAAGRSSRVTSRRQPWNGKIDASGMPASKVERRIVLEVGRWPGDRRPAVSAGPSRRRAAGASAGRDRHRAERTSRHRPCRRRTRGQALVGDRDGVARDLESPGELPRRRQGVARLQPTVEDGRPELPEDLARQVAAAVERDVHVHRPQPTRGCDWPMLRDRNWTLSRALRA